MNLGKRALIAGVCLALPFSLYSQEQEEKEEIHKLETIVVTATKTEEKLQELPNSIIVLDSADIEESAAQSFGQLIAEEPGIDWRTRGNYGGASETISVRGMRDDEVQVMLNGVNINSPSLGSADVSGVPMDSIDRVEIVKGAGSFLYGSGAMAGTINIITKDPRREQMDLILKGSSSSYDTQQLSVEQGMYLNDDFGYYLTVHQKQTDGERGNSDLTQKDGSLKLIYDVGDPFKLTLYGFSIDKEFGKPGVVPPSGASAYYINGEKFYDSEAASLKDRGNTLDNYAMIEAETRPVENLNVRIKKYLSDMDSIDILRNNADSYDADAGAGTRTQVKNVIDGSEANIELTVVEKLDFLLGGDVKRHDWKLKTNSLDTNGDKTGAASVEKHTIDATGVYAEIQFDLAQNLKLLAGARQEDHSAFGTETLPSAGVIYRLTDETALKVTRGKHFKAPTPNDLFWPEDDYNRGNPDLDPQTGWHSDISLEQGSRDGKLFASLTYFQWNVDDKIEWAENPDYPGPYGDKWTPTNISKSYGKGWEANVRYYPMPSLGLTGGYTFTDATDETSSVTRDAQYTPENRLKTGVSYTADFGLTAGATVRYVSKRDSYNSNSDKKPTDVLGSYTLVDLNLLQRLSGPWRISFQVNNLMDQEYNTYTGAFIDSSGSYNYSRYPGAGRSLSLEVAYIY